MEFTVHLDARVGVLSPDGETSDRLLIALEDLQTRQQLAAPAASEDSGAGTVGATFCLDAEDAYQAATRATALFVQALRSAGVNGHAPLVGMQVEEEHEEAAALG